MPELKANVKPKFRFNLLFLLIIFLIASVLLTFGPMAYQWYFAIPTISLSQEVASFNSRATSDLVGEHEPEITEEEVVASINSQLQSLSANSQIKATYAEIARTRRLPNDSAYPGQIGLNSMSGWTLKDGTHYTVWWINLNIKGYGLRIRENNQPVAKPSDEPELERNNMSWIP